MYCIIYFQVKGLNPKRLNIFTPIQTAGFLTTLLFSPEIFYAFYVHVFFSKHSVYKHTRGTFCQKVKHILSMWVPLISFYFGNFGKFRLQRVILEKFSPAEREFCIIFRMRRPIFENFAVRKITIEEHIDMTNLLPIC